MRIGPSVNVARVSVDEIITALWTFANAQGLLTDDINERTAAAGVTIDGVRLKDIAIDLLGKASAANRIFGSDVLGDIDERFRLHAGGTMQWGDGAGARDTTLFRAAANLLATDDDFRAAGAAGIITDDINERTAAAGVTIDGVLLQDSVLDMRALALATTGFIFGGVTGDAFVRFLVQAGGLLQWGDGAGLRDTNLFRAAADELATDDDFNVGGVLDLAGDIEVSERTLVLNNAIHNNAPTGVETVQRLDSTAGTTTITGFAGGRTGRLIFLSLVTSNLVSLSHENVSSTAANRMRLPNGAQITLATDEGMFLRYDNTLSRWFVAGKVT